MQLQRAQQLSKGIRILSTGDLQISISEKERLNILEDLYAYAEDYIDELALNSGNLKFVAEVTTVKTTYDKGNWLTQNYGLARLEEEILAPYRENGWFESVQPEELAALTSATIIGIDAYIDNGTGQNVINPEGKFFWYPDYTVKSFVDELLINGETIFKRAEESN